MSRLLYSTLQLPWPLDNGQKIVTFNDLSFLSQRFDVDVVSYIDPINCTQQQAYLTQLEQRLPKVRFFSPVEHTILGGNLLTKKIPTFLRSLLRREPYVVSKYRNQTYHDHIQQLLASGSYDVFYFESLAPGSIVRDIPSHVRRNVRLIYRAFDIFSETLTGHVRELRRSPAAIAVYLDLLICRQYEQWLWNYVDLIFPVTKRMVAQMSSTLADTTSRLFYFPVAANQSQQTRPAEAGRKRVLYIGTVHYPPNLSGLRWFIRECWPQIIRQHPDAVLDIIGRGGDKLGPVPPSVRIYNYVETIMPFYEQADVFIVPLFAGSGIRLKILDALTQGVPIVSSTAGYMGLEVTPGYELLAADDVETFTAHICALFEQQQLRQQIVEAGYRFVEEYHSPLLAEQAVTRIDQMLQTPSHAV